jgi:hypothetical protein
MPHNLLFMGAYFVVGKRQSCPLSAPTVAAVLTILFIDTDSLCKFIACDVRLPTSLCPFHSLTCVFRQLEFTETYPTHLIGHEREGAAAPYHATRLCQTQEWSLILAAPGIA